MAKTIKDSDVKGGAGAPVTMGLDVMSSRSPAGGSGQTQDRGPVTVAPLNGADRDGRPYCGRHNCVMISQGGQGGVTYYRCKVPGCDEREKRLRGQVPREPVWCGQRNCRDHGVALEVVMDRSNYASLVMCCPKCGFEVQSPRPGFEHTTAPATPAEDFSAR